LHTVTNDIITWAKNKFDEMQKSSFPALKISRCWVEDAAENPEYLGVPRTLMKM